MQAKPINDQGERFRRETEADLNEAIAAGIDPMNDYLATLDELLGEEQIEHVAFEVVAQHEVAA